jgi:hypothetical protein
MTTSAFGGQVSSDPKRCIGAQQCKCASGGFMHVDIERRQNFGPGLRLLKISLHFHKIVVIMNQISYVGAN